MTKRIWILLCLLPISVLADLPGKQGLTEIKQCIMQNNIEFCHMAMTQNSYEVFDKFSSYKLMPCLPTDFRYESEQSAGDKTTVRASMPADNKNNYFFKMVFVKQNGRVKLDLPETLHTGLGENWKNKLDMSEQLFLMMRQNMQEKLTCDVLRDLAKPQNSRM